MAQNQEVFQRYEKKYLLSAVQYEALRDRMENRVRQDEYDRYTICSLYYDTEDYRLIRASLEKPAYKEKLRLRSYGTPGAEDTVFLELKKKCGGVVYKRRAPLSLHQARQYLECGERPQPFTQILREIDWFQNCYRPEPRALICYDRLAFAGREEPGLRITFDNRVRWRDSALDLSHGDWGSPLMERGNTLLEVKIPGAMPLWLSRAFSELGIFPTSFSKYGTCYRDYLLPKLQLPKLQQTGGNRCA